MLKSLPPKPFLSLVASITIALNQASLGVVGGPVFMDGVCVIDLNNTFLGKKENEVRMVAINRKAEILLEDLGPYAMNRSIGGDSDLIYTNAKLRYKAVDGKLVKHTSKEKERPRWVRIGEYTKKGKRGIKNHTDDIVIIPAEWEGASYFRDHKIAKVKKNDLWGIITEGGKTISEPQWTTIPYIRDPKRALVMNDAGWGYLDATTGEVAIRPQYKKAHQFNGSERAFVIKKNGEGGAVIDYSGKELLALPNAIAQEKQGWRIRVSKDGYVRYLSATGWGAVNEQGKIIVPFEHEIVGAFGYGQGLIQENTIIVKKDGLYGFVSIDGKTISKPKWTSACYFNEGLAYVTHEDRWGFINKKGKIVIGPYKMGETPEAK